MKYKFLLAALICFLSTGAWSQVTIITPLATDTIVCDGQPLALHAITNGFNPHTLTLADDIFSSSIDMGFTFNFYGTTHTHCIISSNGYLDFNTTLAGGFSNWSIPTSSGGGGPLPGNSDIKNTVCGSFSDIYVPAGGHIYYGTAGVAPYRRFVVEFCNTHMYSCTTKLCSFQIILYETTNLAEVHIREKQTCTTWNGGAAIEGVEKNTASVGTPAPGRSGSAPTWVVTVPDGRRFTPDTAFISYTCDTIPFNPIPDSSSTIYWYASDGTFIDTGAYLNVNPTVPTFYVAAAISCSDTSRDTAYVTIGTGPAIEAFTTGLPSVCGACDGTISLYGITPGESDTITYNYGGVPQPPIVTTAGPDSIITLTGLCAGVYDNFIIKVVYCYSSPAGPVTLDNPPFAISAITTTNPSVCGACDGTLTVSGLPPLQPITINYSYGGVPQPPYAATSLGDGTITIINLCAGIYSNITASVNTCTTEPAGPGLITDPAFLISGTAYTDASCSACDGTITLNGMTPSVPITINYTLGGVPQPAITTTSSAIGSYTLTNLCPGVYDNITATLNTCTTTPVGPITILAPPLIVINVISTLAPSECGACNGNIVIGGITPYTVDTVFYNFNGIPQTPVLSSAGPDSTVTLYSLCAGAYTDIFIKVGPCPSTTITGPVTLIAPPIIVAFTDTIHYGCNSDTVVFTNGSSTSPSGTLSYHWVFGDGTSDTSANPVHIYSAQGTYSVTLTANHFCIDSASDYLDVTHPEIAAFTISPDTLCQLSPVTFTNTSVFKAGTVASYVWYFGDGGTSTATSPVNIYDHPGVYQVTLIEKDFVPCYDTARAYVYVDSMSGITLTASDSLVCLGSGILFTANYSGIGNNGIVWSFAPGDSIRDVNPLLHAFDAAGTYTVTATAEYRACPDTSASKSVTIIGIPNVNLGPDTSICPGSDPIALVDLINQTNPSAHWLWSTGETTAAILVSAPGYYSTTVTIGGCSASDTVWVANDCYMDMPNVFTPNGDGLNDYFYPRQFLTRGLTNFKMDIYNRWGQLLFESTSLDGRGWDGKFNDKEQPEGVYVYIIDASFKDGQKEHHQGNVTLMK